VMNVLVDGIVYGFQKYGGINTHFNQILPRIAALPDTRVRVLVPPRCEGVLPASPVQLRRRALVPCRTGVSWRLDEFLEPIVLAASMRLWGTWATLAKGQTIFQSTYFTTLPGSVPQVALALDMNHERFPDRYDDRFGRWLREVYPRYLRSATRIIAISETEPAPVW
jgi:hypothetical protein